MSYQSKNLSVLAYANNFTNWHYITEDTLDTVMQPDYFLHAGSMLRKNDLIILNTKDHNSAIWGKLCRHRSRNINKTIKH